MFDAIRAIYSASDWVWEKEGEELVRTRCDGKWGEPWRLILTSSCRDSPLRSEASLVGPYALLLLVVAVIETWVRVLCV
jgi:hypothetical protein